MTILRFIQRNLWVAPMLVLCILIAIIGSLRAGSFAPDQITIKIAAAMTLLLIATGQTIVVLRGGIDLSVGATLGLATALAATRSEGGPGAMLLWMAVILAIGAGVGILNGLLISALKLQPFVVTLATWSIIEGTSLIVLPSESGGVPASWVATGHAAPLGLPVPLLLLGLLVLWWAWFRRTRGFSRLRAAGSGERSAWLNRVSLTGTNVRAYGLAGFFAAAAGLFFATQTGSGSPTLGVQYVLPAIAAVVIGGTSLLGGRGGLGGTIAGALILTLVGDVVFLMRLSSSWQPVMSGLILMAVVILTSLAEDRAPGGGSE